MNLPANSSENPLNNSAQHLAMQDADVDFYPNFFGAEESERLFQLLAEKIEWQQEHISMYGKQIPLPRLTAWYGESGKSYSYSGIHVTASPWTSELLSIRQRIEAVANTTFNSVLLNYYRTESDSVSWHSDDEPELGKNPVIASVSFGAERVFQFRHKNDKQQKHSIPLTSGSLLLMQGETQHHWLHQIPKSKKPHSGRINLTFRVITV